MKHKVLVDVEVMAEMDRAVNGAKDMADRAKQLRRAVREFHDFIKDHRSMDWVSLDVREVYKDRCSHCGYEWEVDDAGVPVCCQKAIDEHESAKNVALPAPSPPSYSPSREGDEL